MTKRLILAFAALLPLLVPPPAFGQEAVVAKHRAAYPTPLAPADAPKLLREIAADLNAPGTRTSGMWGILRKTTGNNCGGYACDIICRSDGQHFDVLIDGPDGEKNLPGQAGPSWQDKGSIDASRCEIVDGGTNPPPPPPPPDLDVIRAIATLSVRLEQLGNQLDAIARLVANQPDLRSTIDDLRAEINALRAKPLEFPIYRGRVLGQPFTLTPQK